MPFTPFFGAVPFGSGYAAFFCELFQPFRIAFPAVIRHVLCLGLKLKVFDLVARTIMSVVMHIMSFWYRTIVMFPHGTV